MNSGFRRLVRALPALLLALLALPAIPQSPERYTVEIVVFRADSQVGKLPGEAALPDFGDDITPEMSSSRKLSVAANRLRNSGNYRVLSHVSWTQAPAVFESRRGVSAARLGMSAAGINGKIILERQRLLHLGVDLAIDEAGARYRISQVRPVKTDEIQYFDHPAVGVLAIVTAAE